MTVLEDLIIRKSALVFDSDSEARVSTEGLSSAELPGLLQAVVEQHAASVLEEGTAHAVSVTLDMSGDAKSGDDVEFRSRIDRKTRTLIFASGVATQSDRHLLKATVVFRIS